MPHRKRTDENQATIVDAFRRLGYNVQITASIGGGFPDLVVSRGGQVKLIEVKQKLTGTFTADQIRFCAEGWPVYIVRSVEDVETLNRSRTPPRPSSERRP